MFCGDRLRFDPDMIGKRGEKIGGVDGFGDIVIHTGGQLSLPVALHGIGRQCDDRYFSGFARERVDLKSAL